MVKKSSAYQSKKPTSRKLKEKLQEYKPKAKAAFLAGLAFAKAHIKTIPGKKKRKTIKGKIKTKRMKKRRY